MNSHTWIGALAAFGLAACGGDGSSGEERASGEHELEDETPIEQLVCFEIEASNGKNITFLFFEFDDPQPEELPPITLITSRSGEVDVTDRVKEGGGPCKDLGLDFRVEVPGPDAAAELCFLFGAEIPGITVGYKAGNLCAQLPRPP